MEANSGRDRPIWRTGLGVLFVMAASMGFNSLMNHLQEQEAKRPDELAGWPDFSESIRAEWQRAMAMEAADDGRGLDQWRGRIFANGSTDLFHLRRSLREIRSSGLTEVRVVRFTKNTPVEFHEFSDLRHEVRSLKNPVPLYSVRFHAPGSEKPGCAWNQFVIDSQGEIRHVDLP